MNLSFANQHYGISRTRAIAPVAKAEAGSIRTTPTSFIGKIVSPIQGLASFIPPLTYILCATFNHFVQPAWMHVRIDLRAPQVHRKQLHASRESVALDRETREAQSRADSPYAVMRHPLYMNMLIQEALFVVMFWSYAPLVRLGITAGAFTVKMPIEEDLI
ncbi:hypothetical protein EDB19DRAFT_1905040 [Suillus lakei]|nr:hypothetical protein EDB19DRAFT_1905040 [Suillus lakei]